MSDAGPSTSSSQQMAPILYEALVSVQVHDLGLYDGFEMAASFKQQLVRSPNKITLVDSKGREYRVSVRNSASGKILLRGLNWRCFVKMNIITGARISILCFRLTAENTFDVSCFDEDGVQFLEDRQGVEYMKGFLSLATFASAHEEFFPPPLLADLNRDSRWIPDLKATLLGPKQDAQVDVIYSRNTENNGPWRYYVVGFHGSNWSTFVSVNGIQPNYNMLVTNRRNGLFSVEVFNPYGIGLRFKEFTPCTLQNYLEGFSFDEDEDDDDQSHHCRVASHDHRANNPSFVTKTTDRMITHHLLNLPSQLVNHHQLHNFTEANLLFGHLKFVAEVVIQEDRRRPPPPYHVVVKCDWDRFFRRTGIEVGELIRVEFDERSSQRRGILLLRIC